ncbi:Holliday junction resolvase subunit Mus81 [Schizosaccharomyces japonicus yFS275]|uniref:Crossover junction endonuclease MUS81 n=1 Tax=Schizosaccharomyces japonicus (strain yFS275 / FY16936) TaxID=402676 RepID=B6JXB7_SCHJY|nr:Holliday junction resolvase subunit Mus81 [Schizosaccharomyces japonicus yFS275]EEB06018.1 Holliday junction resolvase subunit Mus81 [Schizosaccharomyces japonicus yFS275]
MSCGNPLYLQWIQEWMEESTRRYPKSYQTWRKAYESMKNCPVTFTRPSEASVLKGIGPTICAKLEKKWTEYCKENDIPLPEDNSVEPSQAAATSNENENTAKSKTQRKKRPYVPSYRSGAYAILCALSKLHEHESAAKPQIIAIAQSHCESSFEVGSHSSNRYTAWSAMKTLLTKGLVYQSGHPPKYSLTEEGDEVCKRLGRVDDAFASSRWRQKDEDTHDSDEDALEKEDHEATDIDEVQVNAIAEVHRSNSSIDYEPRRINLNDCTILMLLDTREVRSRNDRDYIIDKLSTVHNVKCQVRALELGDVSWIARHNDTNEEFVLDYIVERKRLDDLVASIKDGRFHEQKFRLKRSTIRNVTYLLEESNYDEHFTDSIKTAITSTFADQHFFVKRVTSLDNSIQYLARMSRAIELHYRKTEQLLVVPDLAVEARSLEDLHERMQIHTLGQRHHLSYHSFASVMSKTSTMTVGDVFLRMLMTIRGVSPEKAMQIQQLYPTMISLVEAYERLKSHSEREALLSTQCKSFGRRSIGFALSQKIAKIFHPGTLNQYHEQT